MKNQKKQKVVVAMSGGVDSSVSAALLQRDGFDVVGVFMKCWSDEEERFGQCTSVEDEHSAREAAARLGIPIYTFDFTKEYRERVVDYFVGEYASGRTPNPDVMCNKEIKFGVFFKKAVEELGADYVATGHYARVVIEEGAENITLSDTRSAPPPRRGRSILGLARLARLDTMAARPAHGLKEQYLRPPHAQYKLLRAKDKNKDQSYFLYRLGQEQLAKTLFPVGEYDKPQVREMAREFGLPNAERPDSQGICFIGKVKVEDFLRAYIPDAPGPISNQKGEHIGFHQGLHLYTIGQRKGIGVGGGIPYYVAAKDYRANTLRVAFEHDEALKKNECQIDDIHWISGESPKLPLTCSVRIRYRQPLQQARITLPVAGLQSSAVSLHILFDESQRAVTSGQSAVFYLGEECIGGGIIA